LDQEGLPQKRFRITGRVQGVFFRAWTQKTAQELGVVGTVRNLPDGSVEAHASGSPSAMTAFEAWL
jgi:acylphosphatase